MGFRLSTGFVSLFFVFFVSFAQAGGNPKGFDSETLSKVLAGDIVNDLQTETAVEFHTFKRAFFKGVDAESYVDLAVNHPKYEVLFEEVVHGQTLKTNKERTVFNYALDLKVKIGFAKMYFDGEGEQTIHAPEDPTKETVINNRLTSHQSKVKYLKQNTRLIPYQGGLLVEEEVHLVMKKKSTTNKMIKNYLRDFFVRYVDTFRRELKGEVH